MKTITIGRGDGCDILIDDYRISRRHAILKLYTFGKMEIVDIGQNGTWVNGVKLRPGVPFPVKRSDVINFAEASQLKWSQVDNPMKYFKIAGIVAVILVLLGFLVFWITSSWPSTSTQFEETNVIVGSPGDAHTVKDSITVGSPSDVDKPVGEGKTQKKKETQLPKTVQELFPQKINKEKKWEKKNDDKNKKKGKTLKPQDGKKTEGKSTDKIIY